ncbi:endonuclease/exonuclease/phosphatase family protein [Cyclobacterium sp. 1_MG-2023]|uniref:endonuclease/exonuclease/phosphatase family protein n=1 Tax=Cyclobacterium sp. 1_MG-2023 TaxID=3062681 RepID=UPI0026E21DA2|nr:endonuclease/exonuclease/phosphatase family protein [Cyclobacterium sp. 1_MG-2023]MDO6437516.1 endonuclease/exonuclease/phosphatase family protein [Cyclobacterium sp. 1_MG-2023]
MNISKFSGFKAAIFNLSVLKFQVALLLFIGIQTHELFAQETYNIATYNIRYANQNDEGNLWEDRAPHLINLIQFHEMDIIGTQEGLFNQLELVKEELNFPYIGVGRDTGKKEGEFSAVFYNPEKFNLLEQNTFWLSPTPEKPSKGWDAALNRVCSWAKFKTQDGQEFYVFNVHYDHRGQKAREESSKLVLQKIKSINKENLPCILTGDFNIEDDNPAYDEITKGNLMKDSKKESILPPYGPLGTFTGFKWDMLPNKRIDYIFVNDKVKTLHHGTISDNYGKKYPSDHFPVMVKVQLDN